MLDFLGRGGCQKGQSESAQGGARCRPWGRWIGGWLCGAVLLLQKGLAPEEGLPLRGPRSSACPAPGSGCLFFLCPSKHTGGITLPPLVFHSPYPEPYIFDPSFDACLLCSVHSCLTLCDPMGCSTPGLPVHHQLPELAQSHVHQVSDAIQSSHPLLSPFPPAFSLSQYQGLF